MLNIPNYIGAEMNFHFFKNCMSTSGSGCWCYSLHLHLEIHSSEESLLVGLWIQIINVVWDMIS